MEKSGKIVLAYVTSGNEIMPDPAVLTHINYAFGKVNKTFDGIVIQNEERLRKIVSLKKESPLKIALSIGGWSADGFSQMASSEKGRIYFAADCARICADFELDGIDIDWEYPTNGEAGISATPDDTENYTLLMHNIKEAISAGANGKQRFLTFASYAGAKFIDFRAIDDVVDFVNIMVYDVGRPPFHHSAIFYSDKVRNWTCENAVDAHLAAGLRAEKLVLGLPFYGHGDGKMLTDFIDYSEIEQILTHTSVKYAAIQDAIVQKRDETARVPYLTDAAGNHICSYDDAQSLKEKCEYAKKRGLLGAMYWEYKCDSASGTLRKTVYENMML